MQSEEFDNRIREAADHHHPAYDEKAWMKMEKLLDKHLPQKEDERRRIIFFLLLFLLIGGGISAVLLTGKKANKEQPAVITDLKTVPQSSPVNAANNDAGDNKLRVSETATVAANNTSVTSNTDKKDLPAGTTITGEDDPAVPYRLLSKNGNTYPQATGKREQRINAILTGAADRHKMKEQAPVDANEKPVAVATGNEKPTGQPVLVTNAAQQPVDNAVPIISTNSNQLPVKDDNNSATAAETKAITATNKPTEKENSKDDKTTAQKPIRLKNKKSSFLSLNLSAGPDFSIVGSGKTGKMNLVAGVGLGYTFKGRVTLRAGFYEGNKIYTAAPGDYHAPANFYYYYPNLEKIDANCKVYEIPVSLSYHFGNNPKQNWFASAGVSSYLMKRETYNYFYKQSPGSPTVSRERTLRGVNKHYFSVMTLSGGYQRTINRAMSITVEPYYKLPLKGVGYGKVKLNSSGVLFTVGVKPFEIFKKQKK